MKELSVIATKRPKAPLLPKYPERICWGCEKFCPADDLACGNGTIRTPHPMELFGDDWVEWADKGAHQDTDGT
jgi:hypothetical protein